MNGDCQEVACNDQPQQSQDQAIRPCLGCVIHPGWWHNHQQKADEMGFKFVVVKPFQQAIQSIFLDTAAA